MKSIIYIFLLFAIIIWINGIHHLFQKPDETKYKTVILSKFLLKIGIVTTGIQCLITLIIAWNSVNIFGMLLAIFLFLPCSLIIAYCNCRIFYDESGFTAKSFFEIKRTYSYREITGIYGKAGDVQIFMGKRVVRIDEIADGKFEFIFFAQKQYGKWNNGKTIPVVPPKDVFKGNVERGEGILFAYLLLILFCVVILIAAIVNLIVVGPLKAEDLENTSLVFSRYEIVEEDLNLYVDNESMYYKIPYYTDWLQDFDEFKFYYDSKSKFEIGYIVCEDQGASYAEIKSISVQGGISFFTLEDKNNRRIQNGWILIGVAAGGALIFVVMMVLSIYVGRHPEKITPRVGRIFFRDRAFQGKKQKRERS